MRKKLFGDCFVSVGSIHLLMVALEDERGEVVGAINCFYDVNARKRLKEALRQSEKRFRNLAETRMTRYATGPANWKSTMRKTARQADQVRDLSHWLTRAQDDERRKLARELHDSVGQLLAALGMNLATIERERGVIWTPRASQKALSDSAGILEQITQEVRTISHLLHPPLLEVAGFRSAIEWYTYGFAERSKIGVEIKIPDDSLRPSDETELAVPLSCRVSY
jgi:signal transduction histidine kinase